MVEDGGHAVSQAVEDRGVGARAVPVKREVAVNLPPLLLEVLQEVVGVAALDGKPAGKSGVDVGVAVHEARHDDAAVGVHVLGSRVRSLELGLVAHGADAVAVDGHGATLQVGRLVVSGDDASVPNNEHDAPFFVAGGV